MCLAGLAGKVKGGLLGPGTLSTHLQCPSNRMEPVMEATFITDSCGFKHRLLPDSRVPGLHCTGLEAWGRSSRLLA